MSLGIFLSYMRNQPDTRQTHALVCLKLVFLEKVEALLFVNRVLPISLYRLLVGVSEKLAIALSWSGKPGSNWRPQPWQGCALPTELFPLLSWLIYILENVHSRHRFVY